ncbi:MAG: Rieske 2Fe-2S domain-containing protein [Saprospiraceae bacterium]|nr:Rieske 2Fe-2S domain-containing protein [Saprospiraceae bacterium]
MRLVNDIRQSATLPGAFYKDLSLFEKSIEKVFASTWQFVDGVSNLLIENNLVPFEFLPGILSEPLLMARDKSGSEKCMSNVCTHRGMLLQEAPGNSSRLRCRYHGRCFHLDGKFASMPKFELVENFPTDSDNLSAVPFSKLFGNYFVSLQPTLPLETMVDPILKRLSWMPFETLIPVKEASTDFEIEAHWALYVDNFLEGFHIPFVHPALNQAIVFDNYETVLYDWCNLQIGPAKEGEPHFDIPVGAEDFGKKIYGYYWWVYPNLMLNFYPWGLSLNYVQPLSSSKTKILFRTFRFPDQPFNREDFALDQTEMEDEAVVEAVYKGLQSRYYEAGRFSPEMEKGVHHFHLLLQDALLNE